MLDVSSFLVRWLAGLEVHVEKAAEVWDAVCHQGPPYYHSAFRSDYEDPASEYMFNPRAGFLFDPPPFVPLVSEDKSTVPALFLTR